MCDNHADVVTKLYSQYGGQTVEFDRCSCFCCWFAL